MNSFLIYIIESTISIVAFYMISMLLIKKDADFNINRIVLLSILSFSLLIPQIQMPLATKIIDSMEAVRNIPVEIDQAKNLPVQNIGETVMNFPVIDEFAPDINARTHSVINVLFFFYLSGVLISLMILIRNIIAISKVFRKATVQSMDDFHLVIVDEEIPSFTFMKSVIISKKDYNEHKSCIFNHELAHIRLKHYYDLVLLEILKIIFWFNPVVYLLIKDLKHIHEFQADSYTLKSGVNSVQYQLLIIEKSVGAKRFAMVNSFNHRQVKKRIDMMNSPRKKQSLKWKLLALATLAFILVFSFSSFTEATSSVNNSYSKTDIQGTWKLVSYNYWGGNSLEKASSQTDRIKFIKDNSFCWIDIKSENNQVEDSAGGIYNLKGNSYNEFIEYGGTGMKDYTNNEQKFTIKIDNEFMYLSGVLSSGQKIKEVWVRHNE